MNKILLILTFVFSLTSYSQEQCIVKFKPTSKGIIYICSYGKTEHSSDVIIEYNLELVLNEISESGHLKMRCETYIEMTKSLKDLEKYFELITVFNAKKEYIIDAKLNNE